MYSDSEITSRSVEKECLAQLKVSVPGTRQCVGICAIPVSKHALCSEQYFLAFTTLPEASWQAASPGIQEGVFGLSLLPGQGISSRF